MNNKFLKMAFAGLVLGVSSFANAGLIYLDADSIATGGNLDSSSLIVSAGTISYVGEIRADHSDGDLIAAGSVGNVFDIATGSSARFDFDFDVSSISFIFGGNAGVFNVIASDILGDVVDSFFTNNTGGGAFAGPLTLSGAGIRSLSWEDPGFNFAAIDNMSISTAEVPEPSTLAIFALGLMGLASRRFMKKS
jgi:hypothetical protein